MSIYIPRSSAIARWSRKISDNEGRINGETYPTDNSGTTASVSYGFDSMGRLNTMTDNVAMTPMIASATYGPANELTELTGGGPYYDGNFAGEYRSYNSLKQLTGISSSCWTSSSITYHYPLEANQRKIDYQLDNISGEKVTYGYDALNRLISATTSDSAWSQAFTYDSFGNLTSVTPPGLPSFGTPDANGNPGTIPLPAEGTSTYAASYDVENRLAGVAGAIYYAYAPGNKRVWRGSWNEDGRATDTITFWSVNGQKMGDYAVTEAYGIGVTPAFYATQTSVNYYFGGRLIRKNSSTWVYSDRLRSVGKFYPYGQEISPTTNDTEKFTGYFRDAETGNDYAVNRYMTPSSERFMTPDPSGASAANPATPQGWNMYAYAQGDPINHRDPSGRVVSAPNGGYLGDDDDDDDGGFIFIAGQGYCKNDNGFIEQPGPLCPANGPVFQPVAYAPIPSAIELISECYNKAGGFFGNRYTLVVTYEVVDQNGNRIALPALGAIKVTENVVTTSGPTLIGGGSWSWGAGSITSADTFVDLLNQAPFTEKTSLANQTFYINGVAVPIIGFGGQLGGAPTTLKNSYGPNMVTINGNAATKACP